MGAFRRSHIIKQRNLCPSDLLDMFYVPLWAASRDNAPH
jgi:hypothetical protein